MSKVLSGSAVPRHFVFALEDGTFVVQWDEFRVQELLTGDYRPIDDNDFGHPIADYELNQLKSAGRVEYYNRNYVWLYALPERNRFRNVKTQEQTSNRVRSYYINTTLNSSQIEEVRALLKSLGLADEFTVRAKGELVAVFGKDNTPFPQLRDAEHAHKRLHTKAPEMFQTAAVAFIELSRLEADTEAMAQAQSVAEMTDLQTLIASQTDTTLTEGKDVVLVGAESREQKQVYDLLRNMKLDVRHAETASEALELLEDSQPNLLVMELQLPDMHGWVMLGKVKEVTSLRDLTVIVIAGETATANDQAFALTVAKVDIYLTQPLSMARLRQTIWTTLYNQQERKAEAKATNPDFSSAN